jgi:hypothetical protein
MSASAQLAAINNIMSPSGEWLSLIGGKCRSYNQKEMKLMQHDCIYFLIVIQLIRA